MRTTRMLGFMALGISWATSASAHTGHGDTRWSSTVLHYFVEPEHAWLAGTAIAAAVWVVVIARRRRGEQESR